MHEILEQLGRLLRDDTLRDLLRARASGEAILLRIALLEAMRHSGSGPAGAGR